MAISVQTAARRTRLAQYEATIVDYLQARNGHFVVLSHDSAFMTLLRLTLTKELGQNHNVALTTIGQPAQLLKGLERLLEIHPSLVLIIEHFIKGEDMTQLVRECTRRFRVSVLVLTSQPERDRLMYLHEMGADNFVIKPVSTDTLIAKIAVTIRPMSRFGLEVDEAKQALAEGRFDECLRICNDLLLDNPASSVVHLLMGDTFKAKGRADLAEEYYTAASSTDIYLAPLGRLAQLYGEKGVPDRQLAYLERMNDLSPLNVHRKMDMGELHLSMGNSSEAEQLFDEITTLIGKDNGSYGNALVNRIANLYARHNPERSEAYLRKLLKLKGDHLTEDDISLFNQLGIALRLQGKWREAITEYGKAIRLAPDSANLYYNMGMASLDGKEYTSARQYMLKALHSNPNLPETSDIVALNMGKVFYTSGAQDKAAECLTTALKLNPRLLEAQKILEKIHAGVVPSPAGA